MIVAAALLASGLLVISWQPPHVSAGRLPRATVTALLAAAGAIWLGSLGLLVSLVSGELGGLLAACGVLWDRLAHGDLTWWHLAPAAGWLLLFPVRGLRSAAVEIRRCQRLRDRLTAASTPLRSDRQPALLAPGLGTPAITLGVLRPQVLIDETFWHTATDDDRAVVLAHEDAHRRGRHGLLDALGVSLLTPLSPLPAASHAQTLLRLQLEAAADDAAVRRHDAATVGHALGRIALSTSPATGLGATGANLWRVQRLLRPQPPTRAALLVLPALTGLLAGLTVVTADIAAALGPLVLAANFCLL